MQESGAEALHGDAQAGGGDTGKAPSTAAEEEVTWGRHGARLVQRGQEGGRSENVGGKTSVVRGDDGGREASGVAHKYPRVGDEEGGREASGVAENPQGSFHGGGGGVESPQGADTPRVAELPRGDETPRGTTGAEGGPREDGRGRVGDEKSPPPEQPGQRDPTASKATQWAG